MAPCARGTRSDKSNKEDTYTRRHISIVTDTPEDKAIKNQGKANTTVKVTEIQLRTDRLTEAPSRELLNQRWCSR